MDNIKQIPYTAGGNELLDPKSIFGRLGLKKGMTVADFGCGRVGHFVFPAASLVGQSGTVYAIDVLKPVLESIDSKARLENISNIRTVWSNIEIFKATKIADESLDMAFLINVLFQIKNPMDAIEEVSRTVRPEGKILVIDWKRSGFPFGPPMENRVSQSRINEIMGGLSLRKIDDFEAGTYHYGMIFEK